MIEIPGTYTAQKRADGWHAVDPKGYDLNYVAYDTKRETIESLKTLKAEQLAIGVKITIAR